MSQQEMRARGWTDIDVLMITADPYVDHPAYGTALIARLLEDEGYRVGIIAQPDWKSDKDFVQLGRPRLGVLINAGGIDSMVANYTANRRPRREMKNGVLVSTQDRPDRATIVYTNRIRCAFKGVPVILGGIEVSMRRLAHYDYWDNDVRRSLLIDAKADMLIYGMGERAIVDVMKRLKQGEKISDIQDVRGTVVIVKKENLKHPYITLPSFEDVKKDKNLFNKAFCLAYQEMNPMISKGLLQQHQDRFVFQNPPAMPLTTKELDRMYEFPYQRHWHPRYDQKGGVHSFEMLRWSITVVRGCLGECYFCSLAMHQGRVLQSRSQASILKEVERMVKDPDFRGTISDLGGPTANLYGASCMSWEKKGACVEKQCLMPSKCPSLKLGYEKCLSLYRAIRKIKGVKHVFVGSGLRYDLLVQPESQVYLKELCEYHISGQMKVAPEHTQEHVLKLMNKPSFDIYQKFEKIFKQVNASNKNKRYLVNYFISAYPGCSLKDAQNFAKMLLSKKIKPEQVQDFIPLPMTVAACMYWTKKHPFTREDIYIPQQMEERRMQRALIQSQNHCNEPLIRRAMKILN